MGCVGIQWDPAASSRNGDDASYTDTDVHACSHPLRHWRQYNAGTIAGTAWPGLAPPPVWFYIFKPQTGWVSSYPLFTSIDHKGGVQLPIIYRHGVSSDHKGSVQIPIIYRHGVSSDHKGGVQIPIIYKHWVSSDHKGGVQTVCEHLEDVC